MKYADRIRNARSQPEAMLALAEGIDQLIELLSEPVPTSGDQRGEWDVWSRDNAGPTGLQTGSTSDASTARPFEAIQVKVDPRELEEAREDQRQAEINWERMQSRGRQEGQSPQDWEAELRDALAAMQQAQGRVRLLEDPGAILNNAGFMPGEGEVTRTTEEGGEVIVDLPPADAQRKAARRKLAEAVDLPGFFPNIFRTGEPREQIIHAFEVGGPIWLNANGKFDGQPPVIMQMPVIARQAMIEDVKLDSPRLAFELAREILKDYETLGNLDTTASNLEGMIQHGGAPYSGRGES